MSTNSNDQGRAYEYAWLNTLASELGKRKAVHIVENSSLQANQKAWNCMSDDFKQTLICSSSAAVYAFVSLEPTLCSDVNDEVYLRFQSDEAGVNGDVRDIVISTSDDSNWEAGLSIKHNHEAVKHSRLSHRLDFGQEWFGIPCSENYWSAVKPIFDRLKAEKTRGAKWSDLPDKEANVYIPLLQAFMNEVKKSAKQDPEIPKRMVEYLIGRCDYYKAVSHDRKRKTTLTTFNTHGTLGKEKDGTSQAVITKLPTKILNLCFKTNSTNTVIMTFDNNWSLSFRIHNASTKVEPSLKFDVQFTSTPSSIKTIDCPWK